MILQQIKKLKEMLMSKCMIMGKINAIQRSAPVSNDKMINIKGATMKTARAEVIFLQSVAIPIVKLAKEIIVVKDSKPLRKIHKQCHHQKINIDYGPRQIQSSGKVRMIQ